MTVLVNQFRQQQADLTRFLSEEQSKQQNLSSLSLSLSRALAEADLLNRIGVATSGQDDLKTILGTTLHHLQQLVAFTGGCIALVEQDMLVVRAAVGPFAEQAMRRPLPRNDGVSWQIVDTGVPFLSANLEKDKVHATTPPRSFMAVPLIWREQCLGLLEVDSVEHAAFDESDLALMEKVARQLSGTIELARRSTERQQAERRLLAEYAVSCLLVQASTLDAIADELLHTIGEKLEYPLLGLWTVGKEGEQLHLAAQWHSAASVPACAFAATGQPETLDRQHAYIQQLERSDGLLTVLDTCAADSPRGQRACEVGLSAIHMLPLRVSGELLGMIEFFDEQRHWPDERLGYTLFTIANQIGQFIERTRAAHTLQAREEYFRSLVQNASDMITILDPDGTIRYESSSVREILGYEPEELLGQNAFEFIHPEDVLGILHRFAAGLQSPGLTLSVEYRFRHKDGSWRTLGSMGSNLLDNPHVRGVVVNSRDITERKQAEASLARANERLRDQLKQVEHHNYEVTQLSLLSNRLQSCHTLEEAYSALARSAERLFPEEMGAFYTLDRARKQFVSVAMWGGKRSIRQSFASSECMALQKGEEYFCELPGKAKPCQHVRHDLAPGHLCLPVWIEGQVFGLLHLRGGLRAPGQPPEERSSLSAAKRQLAHTVAQQISLALSNLTLRESLRNQSIRDPLTGLYNRRYLEEALTRELSRASRRQRPISLIMLDLDHFKKFNDTFGHSAGDTLLQALAETLENSIRVGDLACRYGGEEFICILPETTHSDAHQRAEEIRQAVEQLNVSYHGQSLGAVSASLGVATYPDHGEEMETLINMADAALYRAKAEGRNRVICADVVEAEGVGLETRGE